MEPRKLMIVDDDEDLLRGLSIRLHASGYKVVRAADGTQAVSMAMSEKPDLILLDLGLPGGDGYVVMERLRSINCTFHVPIIVLSARDPATDRQRALDAGAAAYFQKPVDNKLLLWAIEREYV
jgi:two-component system KDP operon response regulator KdpE